MPFVKVREPFGYSRLPSTSNVVPFAMRDGEASGTVEDDVALARSVTEESEGAKESKAVALGEREPDPIEERSPTLSPMDWQRRSCSSMRQLRAMFCPEQR